jgi:hypothetical protein
MPISKAKPQLLPFAPGWRPPRALAVIDHHGPIGRFALDALADPKIMPRASLDAFARLG